MKDKHYGRELPGHNLQQNQHLINKKSKEIALYGYGKAIHKLAKSRDKWGLISIITFLCLLVSLYFNARVYW